MANPTAGTKFVSVNLNKSYGQHSSSYGSNQNRANGHGGMVVLSRPRSSHKASGAKLSVPPPLNLPSLRKEHEGFDSLGSGNAPSGVAGSGSGSRQVSSVMGWTKPATIALQEKEHFAEPAMDGFSRGSSVYMPPSARSVVTVGPVTPALVQSQGNEQGRKQKEYFPGPLPLVPLKPRSDWADDERDTSHAFTDRNRDHGFSRNEAYWDRDFDMPRVSVLPQKPAHNFDKRGQRDRGSERNAWDRYAGSEQHNRSRVDSVQTSVSRSSFALGGKGLPINDPLLNFGRERRSLPKSEKSFLVDPFTKDFGASDFDRGDAILVGVVKKKKDVLKQSDFHDPVRESFEAELERVQRMQEQERQQIIEEQERALELVHREEEERLRQAREQEERQRRLEEETREATWRAEQEQIENLRKAEELRLAKEEEKQRIQIEEERRKQAAKQKLLELEQRIARRQVEAVKGGSQSPISADEKIPGFVKEKDASRATDVSDWDDSERMVERIITSASSDSSSVNRPLDTGSRTHFSRDISSNFVDRGKPVNSWRNIYENGSSYAPYLPEHDNGNNNYGPRRDSSIVGKPFMRKDYYGGAGLISSRNQNKGGISGSHLDEYAQLQGQRWNQSGDGDQFSRNTEIDSDFHDNFVDRFGDGWSQSRSRGNSFPIYPERSYPNSESDGPYTNLGRSPYSVRQPRVLPPPTLASVPRSHRIRNEYPGPSAFLDNEIRYDQAASGGSTIPTEVVDALQETTDNKDRDTAHRCDSQSSLSVSSPPSSPAHLSHDDLDGSGDSPAILISEESKNGALSAPENVSTLINVRAQNVNAVVSSCAVSAAVDEEWTTENHEQFQEQEEYDEDEDYQEEDEVHDNIDLNRELKELSLEEKGSPDMMDNLVLGFDEGVQVGMPNEEFERTLKDEETTFMALQDSISTLDEHVSFDNACNDAKVPQPVDDSSQVNLNNNSSVFEESENMGPNVSTSGAIAIAPHSSVGPNVMSSVAAPSQAEPIKRQFGLFSGPSLIPSPVPAIQIGSIQMPLPLHPPVGAPFSHMHPSNPPLFQFGQLRFTSPISQGIMPLGPQAMSFVQPNTASEFSFNHNRGGQVSVQNSPDTSDRFIQNESMPYSVDNQQGITRHLSRGSLPSENAENINGLKKGTNSIVIVTGLPVDTQRSQNSVGNTSPATANESNGQPLARDASIHSVPKEKDFMDSKAHHPVSVGRGRRYVFSVKTPGSRSSGPAATNHSDSRGFLRRPHRNIQRTEFRVRETAKKRQSCSSVLSDQENAENINGLKKGTNSIVIVTGLPVDTQRSQNSVGNTSPATANESNGQPLARDASIHSVPKEKDFMDSKAHHPVSVGRGRRYVFSVKTPGSRSSGPAATNHSDSRGFLRRPHRNIQRTEFRVRETAKKRQSCSSVLSDHFGSDNNSNINGRGAGISGGTGPRKTSADKLGKQTVESTTENSQQIDSRSRTDKVDGKESTKTRSISHFGHSNLNRTLCSEEDVDAPLQSGIIRVFEQPGIEAPSDEDDFIEVRSKRQMLNDRREQREREIKAKSQSTKMPRNSRSTSQNAAALVNNTRGSISTGETANGARAHLVATEGRIMVKAHVSSGFDSSLSSQPLAPIGISPLKIGAHSDLRSQTSRTLKTSLPAVGGGKGSGPDVDDAQTSLGSWSHVQISHSQQVMALTQTQLDEAMKPQQFNSQTPLGDLNSAVNESNLPTSSILTKGKTFSSASSPINSLLAGEKIQFGAVTSPTVLPSSRRSVSRGIGPRHSSRSDGQVSHNLDGSENDSSPFFNKEKHNNESHGQLEDCEAEAAASSVAVAAISNDDIVGNGLGTCSSSG
ncbi:hypothetical protein TanjilG_01013 [Lupinus angustifolius]|uniref:Uncharacterized protein n=1 Tax=Lupinus angustifolius TaxID=3871 RepID=A0A4P1QR35_LUPAN|nr:hypothetical protein TanjilG_01013 [Lupinus angustifolius]